MIYHCNINTDKTTRNLNKLIKSKCARHDLDMRVSRGAEAGGILGVNTPTFLALHPQLFRTCQRTEVREGW